MAVNLAPSSSGPIAQAFDRVARQRLGLLDLQIDRAFNPDACPAELLPWLAYHYGVDVWSTAWSVPVQRSTVRDAYRDFRRRGTRAGLILALGNVLNEVTIIEWWEDAPLGTPGTFRLDVTGDDTLTSATAQAAIAEIVERMTPRSRTWSITVETLVLTEVQAVSAARFFQWALADSRQPATYPE